MFSPIDPSRNKINVWPGCERVSRQTRVGERCSQRVSKLSLAVIATSLGLSTSLSVDIAQLKSTSVVTHEHDRLRRTGGEGGGGDAALVKGVNLTSCVQLLG